MSYNRDRIVRKKKMKNKYKENNLAPKDITPSFEILSRAKKQAIASHLARTSISAYEEWMALQGQEQEIRGFDRFRARLRNSFDYAVNDKKVRNAVKSAVGHIEIDPSQADNLEGKTIVRTMPVPVYIDGNANQALMQGLILVTDQKFRASKLRLARVSLSAGDVYVANYYMDMGLAELEPLTPEAFVEMSDEERRPYEELARSVQRIENDISGDKLVMP